MRAGLYPRLQRKHDNETDDHRPRPARDRDRVLYTGAFRRLAGVTQVAAPLESHLFHSRLTHSLEVAQIGRRISERLIEDNSENTDLLNHLDPDIVEAACLIHDLGHPPFGHIAESELDRLVREMGVEDGFEGNAQSFRIVTRLTVHRSNYEGLDLCRSTLNAILKYPWARELGDEESKKHRKFGAYIDDLADFEFAREGSEEGVPSLEAQIMDYADDIAYSVHDIIDFYQAGLLPLATLVRDEDEFDAFIRSWESDRKNPIPSEVVDKPEKFKNLLDFFLVQREYAGTKIQRAAIRNMATAKIRKYDLAARIEMSGNIPRLKRNPEVDVEVEFLQRVFFHYLISNPRLTTQQHGHRAIVVYLYEAYFDASKDPKSGSLIPGRFRHMHEKIGTSGSNKQRARLACDIVASFTDAQALNMYRRLNGTAPGLISDIVSW